MMALKVEGEWIQEPLFVRMAPVEHFRRHASTTSWERPKLDGVPFPMLLGEENEINTPSGHIYL